MSFLPVVAPPSSFQIGLRTIFRTSEKLFRASTVRHLSTSSRSSAKPPCFQISSRGPRSPSRTLGDYRARNNLLPYLPVRTASRFRFRTLTHYTQLPDSYEDATGLPFRKEDLTEREVHTIFGPHLSARHGNLLLRIIHGRRVAGTLDDPSLHPNTVIFSAADRQKALEYLRKHIPVDEVINAGLRAEDELQAIEAQRLSGTEAEAQLGEVSLHNLPLEPQEEQSQAPTGRLPKKPGSDSPYGESEFDRIRAENIAKREAEERRLEEERKRREEEEAKGNIGTLQTQQRKSKELSPFMKKYIERATSDLEAPPEMKSWERLVPAFAMAVLVCAGCAVFATTYTPPSRSWRLWPDIPPAAATCIGIIAANLGVWVMWKLPPMWSILNKYFLVIAATPRPVQLMGAIFSHHGLAHLAMNMVPLWFFGTRLHDEIGRGNFLALYMASGVVGFAASLTNLVLRRGLEYTTQGASAAVYGITVSFFWMHKYDEFKILGYPPDPMSGPQGLAFIGLILGLHIVGMFSKKRHSTDLASHIGGMLAGVAGMELIRKHMDDRARMRAEKLKRMGTLDKIVDRKDISSSSAA
ncbi:hypothetical protein F4809DRAFT_596222 [Biscogniauxia mediterranea]|nr:hypothetical protein F4809DRAFT_596222 [Biscogniauxia mediterranea]